MQQEAEDHQEQELEQQLDEQEPESEQHEEGEEMEERHCPEFIPRCKSRQNILLRMHAPGMNPSKFLRINLVGIIRRLESAKS